MQINRAQLSDIPALCELLSTLFAQEMEFKADTERQHRGLTRIIENPETGFVLIACDAHSDRQSRRIVGMVNILFTVSTALGDRVALLEDMIVAPNERGRGVGSQLIENAIVSARECGCKRITLLTDHANTSAQRFYQRHGFESSGMLPMRLQLD